MRLPVINLDSLGIIQDIDPHDLPPTAWSSGKNVRFIDGRAEKITGHEAIFTPPVDARFAMPVKGIDGTEFWLYASDEKIYNYSQGVSTDITRVSGGDYTAQGQRWTGGVLNGIPILNNFSDVPQMWDPVGVDSPMSALYAWNSTWRARSLRPFKNYLVAIGVMKGIVDNPHLVCWSHPADPGTVPETWDASDATRDAGDAPIAETDGHFVDQIELRDANILYKTDSVYAMRHIGGNDIFAFPRLQKASGLLMPNGVQPITIPGKGDHHVVFGQHDIYLHDGIRIYSPMRGRKRNWLYKNLDSVNYGNSFITHNVEMQEIWVCFPMTGATNPNMALIWNYGNDTVTERELPEIGFASMGPIPEPEGGVIADTWENATGTWDTDANPWGFTGNRPMGNGLMMFSHGEGRKAYSADTLTTFDGEAFEWYLERIGLNALGKDPFSGKPIFETDVRKLVREVYPRVKAAVGTELLIHVGTQENQDKPVKWHGPYRYIVGVTQAVKPLVSGKALSFRFSCTTTSSLSFSGYDIDVVAVGQY